jgi:hypothetical protein
MGKGSLCLCIFVGCLVSVTALPAQEVIHALTGTVTAINGSAKVITVLQDNGTTSDFHGKSSSKSRIALDKSIADGTIAADQFSEQGAYVIVFYYGNTEDKTVVAFKNLGAGPFTSTNGTVAKFEGRSHLLSVQDTTGAVQIFRLTSDTVAEGNFGALDGMKLQAQKGDHVRVVAGTVNGASTALFVRDN